MMGKMQLTATMVILAWSPRPNQSTNSGMKAILGAGKPIDTSGSKNQRASRLRAASVPMTMPKAVAIRKPLKAR